VKVAVLGRMDFFRCFRVTFDERAQVTQIEPYDA